MEHIPKAELPPTQGEDPTPPILCEDEDDIQPDPPVDDHVRPGEDEKDREVKRRKEEFQDAPVDRYEECLSHPASSSHQPMSPSRSTRQTMPFTPRPLVKRDSSAMASDSPLIEPQSGQAASKNGSTYWSNASIREVHVRTSNDTKAYSIKNSRSRSSNDWSH